MDHASIRPFLVDQPLQQMRKNGGHGDAQRQMIGLTALTLVAAARSQPQACSDQVEHVFVGGPGQEPRRPLHRGAGVTSDRLRDPPVELCRADMPPRHGGSLPRRDKPRPPRWFRRTSLFDQHPAAGA
jgi:hypothetical protein